jgi:hypothetical protein
VFRLGIGYDLVGGGLACPDARRCFLGEGSPNFGRSRLDPGCSVGGNLRNWLVTSEFCEIAKLVYSFFPECAVGS